MADLNELLGKDDYPKVQNEVIIALQISPILYQYSRGNPRVIKRFINMLLLRYAIAENRGYGKDIDLQVLAKLMLAERKWPKFYENIALHLVNGKSPELAYLEEEYNNTVDESSDAPEDVDHPEEMKADDTTKKVGKKKKKTAAEQKDIEWIRSEEYKPWIISQPLLKNKDLRPYYAACKEKEDFFGRIESDDALREILSILMKDEVIVISATDKIRGLSEENASRAFEIVSANIQIGSDLSDEPAGFAGLKVLAETHPSLRKSLVSFVSALPPDTVGEWIITGWEKAIPTGCAEKNQLETYFDRLNQEGSDWVKTALKTKRV